jgi:F0F1-type ATP synthase delta subunit
MEPKDHFVIPSAVITPADLGRILVEVESLDTFLEEAAIRKPGTTVTLPKISKLCENLIEDNKVNMFEPTERARLIAFLNGVKETAPVLHMSFNADPPAKFLQKIMDYLRKNIHPAVMLNVGLQPNIGGGCILRTTNKQFDFTLRKNLESKSDELVKYLQLVANREVVPK